MCMRIMVKMLCILRSIVEEIMLDIMYEIPEQGDVKEFVVTADMVKKKKENGAELIKLPTKLDKPQVETADIKPQLKNNEEIA